MTSHYYKHIIKLKILNMFILIAKFLLFQKLSRLEVKKLAKVKYMEVNSRKDFSQI